MPTHSWVTAMVLNSTLVFPTLHRFIQLYHNNYITIMHKSECMVQCLMHSWHVRTGVYVTYLTFTHTCGLQAYVYVRECMHSDL